MERFARGKTSICGELQKMKIFLLLLLEKIPEYERYSSRTCSANAFHVALAISFMSAKSRKAERSSIAERNGVLS